MLLCDVLSDHCSVSEVKERALERYVSMKGTDPEQLVSGSDDFTLFLWRPAESRKPVARMTGKGEGGRALLRCSPLSAGRVGSNSI